MLQTIAITGASSGIGYALASHLLSHTASTLIVAGRRVDRLGALADQAPGRVTVVGGDIVQSSHRQAIADALGSSVGPRGLFHGAGYFQTGMIEDLEAEAWQRSFEVNVTARFDLSQRCREHLVRGRLLFIGSDAGVNPRAGAAAYSVAQSASQTLQKALTGEWADDVAVGAFKPGLVDTDMVRGFLALDPVEFPARAAYQQYLDRGELASPDTIASFAAWLLCEVGTERFVATAWDVRDTAHHHEWLTSTLYPPLS